MLGTRKEVKLMFDCVFLKIQLDTFGDIGYYGRSRKYPFENELHIHLVYDMNL